jgi:hypothetical protein
MPKKKLAAQKSSNIQAPKRARAKSAIDKGTVYQFKITLVGSKPPIWRRIQVYDGTLDKLHEHIQTAMGWTNSHLHEFEIGGEVFGDPDLLGDGFDRFYGFDSTKTMIRSIVPTSGRGIKFRYRYDFGDSWEHVVEFEGTQPAEKDTKYPVCITGKRACPPEDVGGIWGYQDFLKAIQNPKHKEHREMLEWCGGQFDPEEFDAAEASAAMQAGLPDWRRM